MFESLVITQYNKMYMEDESKLYISIYQLMGMTAYTQKNHKE